MSHAPSVQAVLRACRDLEFQYLSHGDRNPKAACLPFMPFQIGEWLSIMSEVIMEANGNHFLDVGCGPGTKIRLAQRLFGLLGEGIEIDQKMAAVASVYTEVTLGDALDYKRYGDHEIIWLYRPFRDPDLEAELEQRIMEQMKPGAILAGGAWQMAERPPWIPVVDDWYNGQRGAWMKPGL